eukprot:12845656-Alexandrium_andersonii.AAC.1
MQNCDVPDLKRWHMKIPEGSDTAGLRLAATSCAKVGTSCCNHADTKVLDLCTDDACHGCLASALMLLYRCVRLFLPLTCPGQARTRDGR